MKKIFLISITLILLLSGCNNNSIKDIKADYFTISYDNSYYDANNKVDEETVKLLVGQYNDIQYISQTTKEINYANAINIIFIHNDQISGSITIDDKGIFQLGDSLENYLLNEDSEIYEKALTIYHDLKEKY